MNYTLQMYHRQKPVKKSILKFRKAMAFFESVLKDLRKQNFTKELIRGKIKGIRYHQMPEMTEARRRVLKMI